MEVGFYGYKVYRADCSISTSSKLSGGGVLIAVSNVLISWNVETPSCSVECAFVAVKQSQNVLLVGGVYLPPNQPAVQYVDFCAAFEEIMLNNDFEGNVLLSGHFNLPHTDWNDTEGTLTDQVARPVFLRCAVYSIFVNYILNDRGIILDLVFSPRADKMVSKALDPILPVESHNPLLEIDTVFMGLKSAIRTSSVPDYKKSNTHEVFNWVQSFLYPQVDVPNMVEHNFTSLCRDLSEVIRRCTPHRIVYRGSFPFWFTPELKRLVILKKKLHRSYKQFPTDRKYMEFQKVRTQCKLLSKACYSNYINQVDSSLQTNIKAFWGHFNRTKKHAQAPPKIFLNDKSTEKPEMMWSLFSEFFASVYQSTTSTPSDYDFNTNLSLGGCHVTCEEVETRLSRLDENKGPGPDGIPPAILKYCGGILAPHITDYFNALISLGIFPQILKLGYVVPIFKSGDQSGIKNYRPVVIQSSLAKLFEAVVLYRLSFSLKNCIVPIQHGFMRGRSASKNLVLYQDDIVNAFSRNHQVDSIYLDLSKAFDRVCHTHLLGS
ncbi:uncharacterized protein LOC124353261 [Homalodisca vitripennis]|uniref:uncharacterized protein LOC124353261 n=1 Tax=Homalodisca vitripennis TaxID=197043 RepID=UPI001EE9C79B|nr:uncharacterized protein LOC124353261 [Homalodisca vitripennis]